MLEARGLRLEEAKAKSRTAAKLHPSLTKMGRAQCNKQKKQVTIL
ncbi:MAG: hypothetical protein ACYDDI_14800 [Candidatus Acidiferrales bacterium]